MNSVDYEFPDDFMMKVSYWWLHIPSGTKGIHEVRVNNLHEFNELLVKWNASNPGVWQYWV